MDRKSTKSSWNYVSLKQLVLSLFDIKETTSKGRRWVRVESDHIVKWS